MKINDEIEPPRLQLPRETEIVTPPRDPARALDDDEVRKIGMMPDHRLGCSFDEIADPRAGEPPPVPGEEAETRPHGDKIR